MFDSLIEKIVGHQKYGPAMADAVSSKKPLVLNYHTHTGQDDFCISICAVGEMPTNILDKSQGSLEELVHIRGFGKTVEECVPLSTDLGEALVENFGLEALPTIYLNGKPLPGLSASDSKP